MKVFCPEHKRGFLAPRQSPIKCENQGHMLGELDFNGEAKLPVELHWQYCCNCEHFCPIDFDQGGLERCPVCTRLSSALYLCDRCFTISFESNTAIQTKNFTLTSEGAPQPSCPGCLQAPSADLREHNCDDLISSFTTAVSSCPICFERLDIGPSFPSSVAHYLKRTRAANKVTVTFDYESQLFVPVEDGEFVLIRDGDENINPIVLPRSARVATSRDFYEFYQDYYHCPKPGIGEVHVVEPAAVVRVTDGWKFQSPGVLEVLEDQPQRAAPAEVTRRQVDKPAGEESGPSIAATRDESQVTPCTHCGSLVETRYAFCWKCGNPLTHKNEPSVTRWEKPRAVLPLAEIATEEENLTEQHHVIGVEAPAFSWALPREPELLNSPRSSLLKLLAVALAGLVFVSLGLFVLMRSASTTGSSIDAQSVSKNEPGDPGFEPSQEGDNLTTEPPPLRASARPEEAELKRLRARRIAAGASDRAAILKVLASTEKQYPNDYRFPYERAKVAIKARSHDEAFAALSLAAEKAINTGKAHEMLSGLEVDKRGDFRKLSRGHQEWAQLEEALKRENKGLLNSEGR